MSRASVDFWPDSTSVLFTSFWGWSPETWGTVGWTGNRGLSRRTNLLKKLSDPFVTICYVTGNKDYIDRALQGKIAGFYLMSHETGDRDQFTHPTHHNLEPQKWRHSLRAIRAFSYVPEYRLAVPDLDPRLKKRARTVSSMGEILTRHEHIIRLRETPWIEVPVYTAISQIRDFDDANSMHGFVRAGPASSVPYVVSANIKRIKRELYILRLKGDTDAYLGRSANGQFIFKIGISFSPELRRQSLHRALPQGAFNWYIDRTSTTSGSGMSATFEAAVAGEDAMKKFLADRATWLGGEFYLATESLIDEAWRLGHAAVRAFEGSV